MRSCGCASPRPPPPFQVYRCPNRREVRAVPSRNQSRRVHVTPRLYFWRHPAGSQGNSKINPCTGTPAPQDDLASLASLRAQRTGFLLSARLGPCSSFDFAVFLKVPETELGDHIRKLRNQGEGDNCKSSFPPSLFPVAFGPILRRCASAGGLSSVCGVM